MNENRHPIDDLFRDGLNQHSVEPPMHVWERIDQTRTPVYKLVNNFKQNSRWYLSIAAGLVLMSSAAIMFLSGETQTGLADGTKGTVSPAQVEAEVPTETGNPSSIHTESFNSTTPAPGGEVSINPSSPEAPENDPAGVTYTEEGESGEEYTPIYQGNLRPNNGGRSTRPSTTIFGTEKRDGSKGTGLGTNEAPEEEEVIEAPKEIMAIVPSEPAPKQDNPPSVTPEEVKPEVEVVATPVPAPVKVDDNAAIPVTPSPWSLEFLGSYDFMNRNMKNADPAYISARKDAEKMGAAYTFQLRAQYRLNSMFALRSGISFSQHHEKLNFTRTDNHSEIVERQETGYILDPINGPTPITYTVRDTFSYSTTTSAKANNTYTFIDIPVLLNYTFYTSNKCNLGVSGGPMFNMVFAQKGQILGPVNNEIIDLNSASNPFRSFAGVNLMLNMSASYQLCNRFDLLIEPGVRYGMSSLTNKEFGVAQKYSSVNLFTGLRYKF